MTPAPVQTKMRGEIGHLLLILERGVLILVDQTNVTGIDVIARTLNRDGKAGGFCFVRRPANLRVTQKHHAVRAPVIDGVGQHIDVHEYAVGLSREYLLPFTIHMTQAKGGLSLVDAGAKQVKLELKCNCPMTLV